MINLMNDKMWDEITYPLSLGISSNTFSINVITYPLNSNHEQGPPDELKGVTERSNYRV